MEQPRTQPPAWSPAHDIRDDDVGEDEVTADQPDVQDPAVRHVPPQPQPRYDGWLPGDDETREADGSDGYEPL